VTPSSLENLPEELAALKRDVEQHKLAPAAALPRVLSFLRLEPKHGAAQRLYQELSELEYRAGHSTLSHSHPPRDVTLDE
jgi:hypothetical protein